MFLLVGEADTTFCYKRMAVPEYRSRFQVSVPVSKLLNCKEASKCEGKCCLDNNFVVAPMT